MRHAAVAAAALLLAGCGGPLLFAELEIPEVGLTLPAESFPAAPACVPTLPDCVSAQVDFVYDLGSEVDVLTDENVEYELRLTELGLALTADSRRTGSVSDLGGVRSMTIEVIPPGGGEGVVVASYARAPGATPTEVRVTGNANVDLAPYVTAGQVQLRATLRTDSPTPPFTADVSAVFYLRVKLDYGAML
jgi:hypothetical protein